MDLYKRVRDSMMAMQRNSREQGIAAQSLLEAGESELIVMMAHNAVTRQTKEGKLGIIGDDWAITDPVANGEAVLRAFELTEDKFYENAANKMLEYLMVYAPHTEDGVIFYNEKSSGGFSSYQIRADSCCTAPPFLAVMGELNEATKHLFGIMNYLRDEASGCLFHIFDACTGKFARRELWATGNGLALFGIAKVLVEARSQGDMLTYETLLQTANEVLDSMLKYQRDDGIFHDILDKPDTFTDGTAAMLCAAFIYRGIKEGWLERKYKQNAEKIRKTMDKAVDGFGIVRGVCGAPDFRSQGTSVEAQAAWIMMDVWAKK